jgi:hypothetical protein
LNLLFGRFYTLYVHTPSGIKLEAGIPARSVQAGTIIVNVKPFNVPYSIVCELTDHYCFISFSDYKDRGMRNDLWIKKPTLFRIRDAQANISKARFQ